MKRPAETAAAAAARRARQVRRYDEAVDLFARAREFGHKIEDAGNDILPNIRQ